MGADRIARGFDTSAKVVGVWNDAERVETVRMYALPSAPE